MTRKLFSMLLLCVAVVFASCSKDDAPAPDLVPIAFSSVAAIDSGMETTTALTLTFDKVITGLTAADITLTAGETGAVKGALTDKTGGVYELAVSGITKGGVITVAVAKTGYAITPASNTVTVDYIIPAVPVAFNTLIANGSATETTTVLTLTFDKVIEGLAAANITFNAGDTGAVEGDFTDKTGGVYELAVSGITKAGVITVAVAKNGYAITPALKTATVNSVTPSVAVAFNSLAANGSATETTTVLTLTFDKVIEGLAAADITLTAGETGTTKGALTAKGGGVYELAVSGITKGGVITVEVAKTGYTITPASKTVTVNYVAPTVAVDFSTLTANGSATATTTVLTLTFDKVIEGLAATDITLNAESTGAVKGALTAKGGGVYELAVSGITQGGVNTIAVSKAGYTISPASKMTMVYYVPPVVAVDFSTLTANGSATTTTTVLTLTFDKVITGLTAADITLTAGETGAVKGALTAKTGGVYELAVSGITKAGVITVAVAKAGYAITPASKTVTVNYKAASVAVGDFYYDDKTYSATLDASKTCVGIVFWVDPTDATKGKIVSLDEDEDRGSWNEAQTWKSSRTLPSDMTWSCPTKDELQYLFCCYIGITAQTWRVDQACPAGIVSYDNPNAVAFDAKLTAAGGVALSLLEYWSSSTYGLSGKVNVEFYMGNTVGVTDSGYSCSIRSVSAF